MYNLEENRSESYEKYLYTRIYIVHFFFSSNPLKTIPCISISFLI